MQSYLNVDIAQQNAGDPHAMTATRHMPGAPQFWQSLPRPVKILS
jgi:hypothetical protein